MKIHPVKKTFVITGLFLFTVAGLAFTQTGKDKKHKNLKVLSKDISDDELERVMYTFYKTVRCYVYIATFQQKMLFPKEWTLPATEKMKS